MMYVLNSPCFQYFCNFISIYGQNSVKILTNPYTWRHWVPKVVNEAITAVDACTSHRMKESSKEDLKGELS